MLFSTSYFLFHRRKMAALAPDDLNSAPNLPTAYPYPPLKKRAKRNRCLFKTVHGFGKKLGTSFIQLGDNFGPSIMSLFTIT